MNMRGSRLLLAVLLVGTTLTGCSALSPFDTCEDTASPLRKLDAVEVLDLRPAEARPVDGGSRAYCTDDSGDAGLTAERVYVYGGTREEVLDYYGRAVPAAGWRPVQDLDTGPEGRRAVFCFEAAERPSVTLAFEPPERLREIEGLDPGPEAADPGSHVWFSLFAESATDGSRSGCLD
ncbi:hypothetical protein [Streptomyces sp. MS191]|uniref:hypothetical protein n=1 Tax=Streptomyces sp. ms191 TaxID=1827978 RepID=UPI0011CDCA6D|nr:hypothetical protein [Streptomyces sp. ms191]